ncbi:MAG: hypothetical protein P4L42_00770 [Desulfocapsaceae bacterium]|nr:hypothetical protein [Desulfocapsaceae bacterium]
MYYKYKYFKREKSQQSGQPDCENVGGAEATGSGSAAGYPDVTKNPDTFYPPKPTMFRATLDGKRGEIIVRGILNLGKSICGFSIYCDKNQKRGQK